MRRLACILLLLAAGTAGAQTNEEPFDITLRSEKGSALTHTELDNALRALRNFFAQTEADYHLFIAGGAGLPATCEPIQIWVRTDAATGQRIYICESTDTWVLQGDGTTGDVETLSTSGGSGTAPVSDGVGALAMTDVATEAELTTHTGTAGAHHTKTVDASELTAGTIPAARVGAAHVDALTELAGALCGTGEILEDQGASWACVATPTGASTAACNDNELMTPDGAGGFTCESLLTFDSTDLTLGGTGHVVLPQVDDPVTPTLGFGDGGHGIYSRADNEILFAVGGAGHVWLQSTGLLRGVNANAWSLSNVTSSATNPTVRPNSSDVDTGLGHAAANQLSLIAGAAEVVRITKDATTFDSHTLNGVSITSAQSATCADSGDGNPGTLTLIPTSSYVEITNSDANGCDVTMSETGAVSGAKVDIIVVSNAGGNVTFADTAGVSEIGAALNMDVWDALSLRYSVDRWVEISRSDN